MFFVGVDLMKLTERQRWDVMRAMVKQKNDEYSSFLLKFFDQKTMSNMIGLTRDTFLVKCRLNPCETIPQLEAQVKSLGKKPASNWIDNLSSEDLLLFLDYRCKVLQQVYKYYKMYRRLDKYDLARIIDSTQINALIGYNYGKLLLTGKPERAKDEVKASELGLTNEQLMQEALAETMGKLASTYCQNQGVGIVDAQNKAQNLLTYNIDEFGHKVGYQFTDIINISQPLNTPKMKFKDTVKPQNPNKEDEMEMKGLDVNRHPIYLLKGKYVNSRLLEVSESDIVYDIYLNLIEKDDTDLKC
jgi:hypothetical protein